jgi:hypothetical protein
VLFLFLMEKAPLLQQNPNKQQNQPQNNNLSFKFKANRTISSSPAYSPTPKHKLKGKKRGYLGETDYYFDGSRPVYFSNKYNEWKSTHSSSNPKGGARFRAGGDYFIKKESPTFRNRKAVTAALRFENKIHI